MKSYQKTENSVKESIEIIDVEALKAQATAGLLNLSLDLGLAVVAQILEQDVTELAGAKGKHNANRSAYRHGTDHSRVVMGGQKVGIDKPRVRSKEGEEIQLPSLRLFQNQDPLNEAILGRLLSGVSTRKYERTLDARSEQGHCTSKSEVNRRFVAGLETMMKEFFSRRIEVEYHAIMIDGVAVGDTMVLVALGIDDDGKKRVLGITQGGSENHTVVEGLLTDLMDRGLTPDTPRLFVLDGGKGLYKGVRAVFGLITAKLSPAAVVRENMG